MEEKIQLLIRAQSSDEAVKLFKYLYEKFLSNEYIKRAEIRYVKSKGLVPMDSNPNNWPLQMFTDTGIRISVYNVTAGYCGSGPTAMYDILNIAGFRNIDSVLYCISDAVELNFYRTTI